METIAPLWLWVTFGAIVLVSLFIDFWLLKKQGAQDMSMNDALRQIEAFEFLFECELKTRALLNR